MYVPNCMYRAYPFSFIMHDLTDSVWYIRLMPEKDIKWLATCGLDGKVCLMDYSDCDNLQIIHIIQGIHSNLKWMYLKVMIKWVLL